MSKLHEKAKPRAKKTAPATTTDTAAKTAGDEKLKGSAATTATPAKATRLLAMHKHPVTTAASTAEGKTKSRVGTAEQPVKAKKEPKPKAAEELCVFALRMTPNERDRLHAAAGPARATRLARAVLIAAADGDVEAFRLAVKQAAEARAKAAAKK